jgi:hypothetical protein
MIEIRNRFTGTAIYGADAETIKIAVEMAVVAKINLSGADLSGADLSGAELFRAYLSGAYLSGANLSGADLSRAYMSGANLSRANLSRADLSGADLSRAYMSGADLFRANLSRADLFRANLVDGGQRSDGYRFVGWIKDGVLQIRAGCRDLTITKARAHWSSENYPNRERGDETMCILDHIERVAEIRRLVDKVEQNDG